LHKLRRKNEVNDPPILRYIHVQESHDAESLLDSAKCRWRVGDPRRGRDILQCANESDAVKTAQEANALAQDVATTIVPSLPRMDIDAG